MTRPIYESVTDMSKVEELEFTKPAKYLYQAFLAVTGAIIFRIRGGLPAALPRPIDQFLFSLAYGAIVYKAAKHRSSLLQLTLFIAVMVFTTAALTTGHGQYMDLATWQMSVTPETLDFIVQWFFGADNYQNYWRDAFGLAVTGLVVSLPAGIALVILRNYIVGVLVGLSGVLKAPAYMLSWHFDLNTAGGEYLTGFFLWGAVIVAWNFVKENK